ncbi:HpcH/HpaI aldolase family protein [Muricoccus aerilatus]|uniref:HpcH/HpaI aldolase family protein n=1 Tax=Muricoccus aerilatus TaxID=452982 RepID=UPI00069436CA|nr:aldolase/citrate lyase family protein [Roseomonas aerilata]
MSGYPGTAFRARMQAGELALGSNLRLTRSAEAGPILAACGFHWAMLDFEHSPASPHIAHDVALSAIRAGILPLARPSSHDPHEIAGLLTNGALGLVVPHVDTPEQAAAVARAARFAPRGNLSVPGTLAHFGYDKGLAEACAIFNEEVVVAVMIESRTAVENVEAIAAVPGVDGLFIGGSDLLWDLGLPGRYDAPELLDAVERTCAAAARNGLFAGMGGPRDEGPWHGFLRAGMRMILTENDLSLMMRGARDRRAFFEGVLSGSAAVGA